MGTIKKASVFAAAFLGMFVGSARAQGIITVKVPFPFVVNKTAFPAGEYSVRADDSDGAIILIEGVGNNSEALALAMPADGRDPAGSRPALVFTRYENEYRLSQIWESSTEGKMLPGTSAKGNTRAEMTTGPFEAQLYVLEATGN